MCKNLHSDRYNNIANPNITKLSHIPNNRKYTGDTLIISNKWHINNIKQLNAKDKNNMVYEDGLNTLTYTISKKVIINEYIEKLLVDI